MANNYIKSKVLTLASEEVGPAPYSMGNPRVECHITRLSPVDIVEPRGTVVLPQLAMQCGSSARVPFNNLWLEQYTGFAECTHDTALLPGRSSSTELGKVVLQDALLLFDIT